MVIAGICVCAAFFLGYWAGIDLSARAVARSIITGKMQDVIDEAKERGML